MSETPIYFFLAQLNSLMTGAFRLALAWGFLGTIGSVYWAVKVKSRSQGLSTYFYAWASIASLLGLFFAGAEKILLPYQNIFVNQALISGFVLAILSLFSAYIQIRLKGRWWTSLLLGSSWLSASLFLPTFSRSDKILLSVLMSLSASVSLAYFASLLSRGTTRAFHGLFLVSMPIQIILYVTWLSPRLKQIPQAGEFFPFINLYDWFWILFMILYLGNFYIDFWLSHRRALALSWNYLVVVLALLSLWLNTNIFDTLAL